MIKSLFPRDWARYSSGPQAVMVRDFAVWVVERGYTRLCAQRHVRRCREVLIYNNVAAGAGQPITAAALARWFAPWADDPLYCATRRAAERFLDARGLLVSSTKQGRFAALLSTYRSHLVDLRGLAPATVKQHLDTVNSFLLNSCPKAGSLARLVPGDVERFVGHTSRRLSRQSLQHTVAHLRAFLRFCADHGHTPDRLDLIDTPRTYRGELPPRALDWRMVRKLLHSIDRSNAEGCRDHAILYLMAYYGLRPSEVAGLTVDSLDWDRRTLRVEQCKTRSALLLPLGDQALRVLSHYLHSRRPGGPWPALFLRVRCPAGPIKGATITDIYAKRARLSGLPIQWSSSYSLRHSFALRLLERGVGVKAIGDLLGHHSLESTCVYLRLQADALREVALPLPGRRCGTVKEAP